MNKNSRIYIPGHRGLVGSAIVRKLQAEGFNNHITRSRDELDLRNQVAVDAFFASEQPVPITGDGFKSVPYALLIDANINTVSIQYPNCRRP